MFLIFWFFHFHIFLVSHFLYFLIFSTPHFSFSQFLTISFSHLLVSHIYSFLYFSFLYFLILSSCFFFSICLILQFSIVLAPFSKSLILLLPSYFTILHNLIYVILSFSNFLLSSFWILDFSHFNICSFSNFLNYIIFSSTHFFHFLI